MTDLSDGSGFDLLKIDAPTSVAVTQTGSPVAGEYSLQVNSLASSQVLATSAFDSAATEVGTGSLTISVGTPAYATGSSGPYSEFTAAAGKTATITVDSSNNSVSGIRDAVTALDIGVTASIVLDGRTSDFYYC